MRVGSPRAWMAAIASARGLFASMTNPVGQWFAVRTAFEATSAPPQLAPTLTSQG